MGWSSIANLPTPSYSMGAAGVNGKIYSIGGFDGTHNLSTVYVYNPAQPAQAWSNLSSLPAVRSDLAAASVNGKIYAIGGYDGSVRQATVYVYDTSQPALGWLSVSNLPAVRSGLAAATADGKIYAIGGYDGTNSQATVYVYNPAQPAAGWLSVSNLPAPYELLAAASADGKIYALGGENGGTWQATAYVYDPIQPTLGWQTMSNPPAALWGPAAASADGKIYFLGGSVPYSSPIYVYDPSQPTLGWTGMGALQAHGYMGAAGVNGQIYAFGGADTLPPYTFSTGSAGTFATGVVPSSSSTTGGSTITISGDNLGNGDVTSVTLCGVSAAILADNSPTQVVVSAGVASIPSTGNVMVNSTSYGVTVASNAFIYLPPAPNALAATNITLNSFYANWSPVSGAASYLLDVSTTNNFSTYVAGCSNLNVGNVTTLWVNGLNAATTYYYRVRCQENSLTSGNSSAIALQTLNGGAGVSSGPAVGGNILVISGTGLGNGSDIYNVTICGVVATIQSQTPNSVTVVVATGPAGTGNITVSSTSRGVATFVNGYTFNPPGAITGAFTGWLSASNLPVGLVGLCAAGVNGKIYAIGGSAGAPESAVYVYDPLQPAQGWLSVTNLPGGRENSAVVSLNGKIYVIGGYDGGYILSTVDVFDTSQPAAGWLTVSNLPAVREYLGAATAGGKIYAIGGYYSYDVSSAVYVYDPAQPTQGWLSVSNLPVPLENLAAAGVNDKIYAIGGGFGGSGSSVYVYDPSQPALGWLSVSNLPTPLFSLAAASANGKILAIGGTQTGVTMQPTVYVYDPLQSSLGWLSVANLPSALAYLAATSLNGTIYVLGGYDGRSYYSTVYLGTDIPSVSPSSGPLAGGNTVTINGNNLGNGDVTSVTLCGIPAAIVTDNSPTQIVVSAGVATGVVTGNVVVNSTSFGLTVKSNAYAYLSLLTITTGNSLPPGTVGTAYSQTLTAASGVTPYTWSLTSGSLPAGLNLSASGIISGTPAFATNANFTVQVTDHDGYSSTQNMSLATALTVSTAFDGTHLQLTWPTNYLGWELQVQTNAPGAGLGTNWYPVTASTATNRVLILINRSSATVFYRLHQ